MKKVLVAAFMLCCWVHCFAQLVMGLGQERVFIDGSGLWTMDPNNPKAITLENDASGRPVSRIEVRGNAWIIDRVNGLFWACRRETVNGERRLRLQSSPDGTNWSDDAVHVTKGEDRLFRIFPLGDGWYLNEYLPPIGLGDMTSKWAFSKTDDHGILKIQRLVDMGLPAPLVAERPKGKGGWSLDDSISATSIAPMYRGIAADFVVRAQDGLILASGHTGFIWIVTMQESGPSVRMVPLFPSAIPFMKKHPGMLEWSIIGLQPMPNGSVLIASRSEEAVMFARINAGAKPMRSLADFQDAIFMDRQERAMKASIVEYPDICWWSLDVKTGAIKKELPPVNIPSRFENIQQTNKFRFRPKLDGNLIAFF